MALLASRSKLRTRVFSWKGIFDLGHPNRWPLVVPAFKAKACLSHGYAGFREAGGRGKNCHDMFPQDL